MEEVEAGPRNQGTRNPRTRPGLGLGLRAPRNGCARGRKPERGPLATVSLEMGMKRPQYSAEGDRVILRTIRGKN